MEQELHGVQGAECLNDKTALEWASLMARPLKREDWGWILLPLVVTFQPLGSTGVGREVLRG